MIKYRKILLLNGYNSVSNATRLYWLAYIRRYFHTIIVNLDRDALKNSRAIIGLIIVSKFMNFKKSLDNLMLWSNKIPENMKIKDMK